MPTVGPYQLRRFSVPLIAGIVAGLLLSGLNEKLILCILKAAHRQPSMSSRILEKINVSVNGTTKYRLYELNADYVKNLRRNISVLCYINTHTKNHYVRAIHVHNTWASRCTKHIFLGVKTDPVLPVVDLKLETEESRRHLWSKIRKALRHIYDNHLNDFDYFLKADDDTYIYMDNLRYTLQTYSPDEPFMMGHRFRNSVRNGFFSGGAGYVLSREALKRIVEHAIDKHPYCPVYDENKEDMKMSICGQAVGVRLYDARDPHGHLRFRWRSPDELFKLRGKFRWMPPTLKPDFPFALPHQSLLSDSVISFHYVSPKMMYIFDFFQYHIRPIGITNGFIDV